MRKLRIFLVELVLVALIVGWALLKFPDKFDGWIPLVAIAIVCHLIYECVWQSEAVKRWRQRNFPVAFVGWIFFGLASIVICVPLWLAARAEVKNLTTSTTTIAKSDGGESPKPNEGKVPPDSSAPPEEAPAKPRNKSQKSPAIPRTQTPPVQNPVSAPMPMPPNQQLCVQGNICNQDSPVNAPQTVNNFGQKPPEILGYELVPTSNLPEKPAVTKFKFYTGSVWDDPKFAVICDRPCKALEMEYVSPPPVVFGPIFETGTYPDAPNFAIFLPLIKPFPADRYFVFTVASQDSTPVQIIRVASLVAPVKPR